MTASKGDMRELKETCVRLLRLGWQDTDQCFEKLSHVIEFKTRGDTAQALSHWQAALRYRAAAAKSLNEAAFILNTVPFRYLPAVRLELENVKLLNRVRKVGLGMLMSAMETCLIGQK